MLIQQAALQTSKTLEVRQANGNSETIKKKNIHFPFFFKFQLQLCLLPVLQSPYVMQYEFMLIPLIRAPFFCATQQNIYMHLYKKLDDRTAVVGVVCCTGTIGFDHGDLR